METVSVERDGHVLMIGLNRPEKRNAFTQVMLAELATGLCASGVRRVFACRGAVRPR